MSKLHLTLINTSLRKYEGKSTRRRPRGREPIDRTSIPAISLGDATAEELLICRMGSRDKDGHYVSRGGFSFDLADTIQQAAQPGAVDRYQEVSPWL